MNTIFVISSNKQIRAEVENVLTSVNYDIVCFSNVAESSEQIKLIHPALIYLDSCTENFLSFLSNLKRNHSTEHIPVIVITEPDRSEIREKALDNGADDFLTKPVEKTELKSRTRLCLKSCSEKINSNIPIFEDIPKKVIKKEKLFSVDTIQHLVRVCALRDEKTCAHAIRVAYYSAVIARKLGFNDTAVKAVFEAASLHDVGKVAIPDSVLLKPGSLNSDEIQVVRTHTNHGQFILENSDSDFVRLAEAVAVYHHERLDGSGYPGNLKGEKIPLGARIVAVADVFDALVSRRCYKESFPLDKSYQMIWEGCNSHFDTKVVESFFDIQDEILFIKDRLNDKYVYNSLFENSQECIPLFPLEKIDILRV